MHRYEATLVLLFLKHHGAVDQGEEGMVLADTDIITRKMLRAALAHDDVAGCYVLTAVNLNAEAFAMGFASVLGTTDAFFMCHALELLVIRYTLFVIRYSLFVSGLFVFRITYNEFRLTFCGKFARQTLIDSIWICVKSWR